MLKKLLRTSRNLAVPPMAASVPAGVRIYAVGDVHGCRDELDRLIAMIEADDAARSPAETMLVFLGDLIDRGPDSAAVLDLLVDEVAAHGRRYFLRGNHEEMALAVLDGDLALAGDWLAFGGQEMVESYGVDAALYWRDPPAFLAALQAAVPARHVAFLRAMLGQVRIGDYLFVHAGIRPGVPLDAQDGRDLRWIRGEFLDSRADHGVVVVHGHTVTPTVQFRHNRIGIDTGAYDSGRLTALGLEGLARWTLTSRLDAR